MNTEKINRRMQELTDSGEMAAGTLMISQNHTCIFQGKWGYMNQEKMIPVQYDTIFRIMSMTKVLTAAGVMKLYEEHKIGLDDEVVKYIPEYGNMMVCQPDGTEVKAIRELTIRDLLTHSSGIGMNMESDRKLDELSNVEDQIKDRVLRWSSVPLDFQPGTKTGYSPKANFDILAYIIEFVSGMSFEQYMKKFVFMPLEMTDTCFHLNNMQEERLMQLYKTVDGKYINVTGSELDVNRFAKIGSHYTCGSGGAYSTVMDYHKFTEMLCNEGCYNGMQILKPETVRAMYTEMAYEHPIEIPGLEWGLGVRVRKDPDKAGSHAYRGTYGWSGAFGTHMFVSPEQRLAVTFMMNRENIGGADSYIIDELEALICE